MTWLTLRQFRGQAIVVLGAVAVFAVLLGVTGVGVERLYDDTGEGFRAAFLADGVYRLTSYLTLAVGHVLPAVVGVFWGAPLVAREIEAGTHRLVWSQGVTRPRWLATKLGVVAVGAALVGLVGLVSSWWFGPVDATVGASSEGGDDLAFGVPRLAGLVFGARGVVPVGFALLALALGVTIGLLMRRTVPAMAATLVAVVAVQVAVPFFVQPRLMTPIEGTVQVTEQNVAGLMLGGPPGQEQNPEIVELGVRIDSPGAWVLANDTIDADGHAVEVIPAAVAAHCVASGAEDASLGPPPECFAAIVDAGYRQHVVYHPADRYWTMQWRETVLLVSLAGLLIGFCFWRIRRDLA